VRPEVRSACDLLGLDPLNIANEGKAVIVCDTGEVDGVLALLRNHPLGAESARIGTVTATPKTRVILETRVGGERIVDTPVGDDLPRIC
jgi:hydrogenase expression/formation protein HypE